MRSTGVANTDLLMFTALKSLPMQSFDLVVLVLRFLACRRTALLKCQFHDTQPHFVTLCLYQQERCHADPLTGLAWYAWSNGGCRLVTKVAWKPSVTPVVLPTSASD
ncbi:unnamed protein product [Arctogadus glacialis]